MDVDTKMIRPVKTIPRSFAVAIHAHNPGPVNFKLSDVYGSNVPTPLARPTITGGGKPRPRKPSGPFPWEKPIPINTRDIEQELRRYTDTAEPRVARWLYSTWNAQRDAIKYQEIRNAIRDGALSREWIEQWREDYSDYVNDVLAPEWANGWRQGGEFMAGEMADSLGVSWRFPAMTNGLREWVKTRGASLAVNLTTSQTTAVRNILEHYGVQRAVGPRALEKYIRPIIGLTPGEAAAVARRRDLLTAQGLKPKAIDNAVENYSGFLHRRRALRIARTETAFAYNYGALDAVREAKSQGAIQATQIDKEYLTAGDERTCPFCSELDGQSVTLEDTFPGLTPRLPNVLVPPVHPNCRCVIIYNVVGLDETPAPSPIPTPPVLSPIPVGPKPPAPKPDIPPAAPTIDNWKPATTLDEATERMGQHTKKFNIDPGAVEKYGDAEIVARLNTIDAELTRCQSIANLKPMTNLEIKVIDAYGDNRTWAAGTETRYLESIPGQLLNAGEDLLSQLKRRPIERGNSLGTFTFREMNPGHINAHLAATVRHEYGHYITGAAFNPALGSPGEYYTISSELEKRWYKNVTKWRRKKFLREWVSEYGQSGPKTEAFSELFVIYSSPKFVRGSIDAKFGKGAEKLIQEIIDTANRFRGR